jgi:3-dehydroquinate synthase
MAKKGLKELHQHLQDTYPDAQICLLTDENLFKIVETKLETDMPEAHVIVVEASEASKSMETAEEICKEMLEHGFGKNTILIGLGGGMITDLAGFVAAIFRHGIHYVAMPTSLLAMIDASVGGKTNVNLGAKNVIGVFYPAEMIMIDLDFLDTLPERQLKTGVAEVIKYSAVLEPSLEEMLMDEATDFETILEQGLRTKAGVCNEDLDGTGGRRAFFFGHEVGHALEHLSKYALTHGEGISIGMMLSNQMAQKLGLQENDVSERVETMLKKYDLPTVLPEDISVDQVLETVYKDTQKPVNFVLCTRFGEYVVQAFEKEEVRRLLS